MAIATLDFSTDPPTEGTLSAADIAQIPDGSIVLYPSGTGNSVELTIAQLKNSFSFSEGQIWTPTISNVLINGVAVANSVITIYAAHLLGGNDAKHFQMYYGITPPAGSAVVQSTDFRVTFPDDIGNITDFYADTSIYINYIDGAFASYLGGESGGGPLGVVSGDTSAPFTRGRVGIAFQSFGYTAFFKIGVMRGLFIL